MITDGSGEGGGAFCLGLFLYYIFSTIWRNWWIIWTKKILKKSTSLRQSKVTVRQINRSHSIQDRYERQIRVAQIAVKDVAEAPLHAMRQRLWQRNYDPGSNRAEETWTGDFIKWMACVKFLDATASLHLAVPLLLIPSPAEWVAPTARRAVRGRRQAAWAAGVGVVWRGSCTRGRDGWVGRLPPPPAISFAPRQAAARASAPGHAALPCPRLSTPLPRPRLARRRPAWPRRLRCACSSSGRESREALMMIHFFTENKRTTPVLGPGAWNRTLTARRGLGGLGAGVGDGREEEDDTLDLGPPFWVSKQREGLESIWTVPF
jgi:hypothetical protein